MLFFYNFIVKVVDISNYGKCYRAEFYLGIG